MPKLMLKIFTAFAGLIIITITILNIKSFAPEFKEITVGNPEKYVEKSESGKDNLKKDCEKKIIWANKEKNKTKISLVYIPGFSATRKEIFPVMETLAKQLNANLFLSRFPFHGERPEDYKNLKAQDFFDTAIEAYAIGSELGEEVVLVGTSTGAVMIAQLSLLKKNIKAMVLISPAFKIMPWATELLASPLGGIINKMMVDEYRTWEAKNPDVKKYWDTTYHRDSLPELMKAIYFVKKNDFKEIKTPTLVLYTKEDKVISIEDVLNKFKEIGSENKKIIQMPSPSHVLAGEFTSPQTTQIAITEIKHWLEDLGVKSLDAKTHSKNIDTTVVSK